MTDRWTGRRIWTISFWKSQNYFSDRIFAAVQNLFVVQKCCFAGCRLLGGQGDGLPGMGVPKLAVAPHKLLTPHKHGSYRIIKYQTIPDQSHS